MTGIHGSTAKEKTLLSETQFGEHETDTDISDKSNNHADVKTVISFKRSTKILDLAHRKLQTRAKHV